MSSRRHGPSMGVVSLVGVGLHHSRSILLKRRWPGATTWSRGRRVRCGAPIACRSPSCDRRSSRVSTALRQRSSLFRHYPMRVDRRRLSSRPLDRPFGTINHGDRRQRPPNERAAMLRRSLADCDQRSRGVRDPAPAPRACSLSGSTFRTSPGSDPRGRRGGRRGRRGWAWPRTVAGDNYLGSTASCAGEMRLDSCILARAFDQLAGPDRVKSGSQNSLRHHRPPRRRAPLFRSRGA